MIPWIILLTISSILFVIVVAVLLPNILLKNTYSISSIQDRGIKNTNSQNANVIVYEPDPSVKKYIKQYALSKEKNGKFLICKINENLSYINYDVAVYNENNQIITVINVKEKIKKQGYCEDLSLPDETSYVNIILNEVDKIKFDNNIYGKITAKSIWLYILVCSAIIFLQAFCVKICLAFILGDVFRESFILIAQSNLLTAAVALILSVINALLVFAIIKMKNRKDGIKVK